MHLRSRTPLRVRGCVHASVRRCANPHLAAIVALTGPGDGRSRDAMLFGVQMFSTHYAIRPDVLAREAEARGFESVWFPEHTHIPTSRRSPWPGGPVLPKEYSHTYDLFVALAAAAAATTRIKVASGICLLIERDPITTAKEVASIDHLSGGRVLFGIGAGWNAEEMEHHGTVFRTRWKLLSERVLAMKTIWTEDEAQLRRRVRPLRPDLVVAEAGAAAASAGHPRGARSEGAGARRRLLRRLDPDRRARRRSGRRDRRAAPAGDARRAAIRRRISINVYGTPADPEQLGRLRDARVTRAIFALPPAGPEKVLSLLDRYAGVAQAFASAPATMRVGLGSGRRRASAASAQAAIQEEAIAVTTVQTCSALRDVRATPGTRWSARGRRSSNGSGSPRSRSRERSAATRDGCRST